MVGARVPERDSAHRRQDEVNRYALSKRKSVKGSSLTTRAILVAVLSAAQVSFSGYDDGHKMIMS